MLVEVNRGSMSVYLAECTHCNVMSLISDSTNRLGILILCLRRRTFHIVL